MRLKFSSKNVRIVVIIVAGFLVGGNLKRRGGYYIRHLDLTNKLCILINLAMIQFYLLTAHYFMITTRSFHNNAKAKRENISISRRHM